MLAHSGTGNRPTLILAQCDSDAELIDLWLHGKSSETKEAYRRDLKYLKIFTEDKPLRELKLNDLYAYQDGLEQLGLSRSSIRRKLYTIKSLLSFGAKVGYLNANLGAALSVPPGRESLAERILTEEEVQALLSATTTERDRLMLKFLYKSGCRISELCVLKWKHLTPNRERGQVTITGKGDKVREVNLDAKFWAELIAYRGRAKNNDPLFPTRTGKHFNRSNINRLLKAVATRAGMKTTVSPHWLRHSHATHSLHRGAPIDLVAGTLGHSSVAVTSKYLHAKPSDSSSLYLPD